MTFKDINLKTSYTSLADDVAGEFYIPVMQNAVRFDRMTCYFSPKALSRYSIGLYHLGKRDSGKYRLLISREVSKETFELIRDGYRASILIDEHLRERMRDELSIEDHDNLSNLAFLMECKIVEVKFAFCLNGGLFHIKSGYAEDGHGNTLCFKGSNNETSESIERNYESFDVTTSWMSSPHDSTRISDERERFDMMWSGGNEHVVVADPSDSFREYILSFNRGGIVDPQGGDDEDAFLLDYDTRVRLRGPVSFSGMDRVKFRLNIQSQVDRLEGDTLFFKEGMSRGTARRLSDNLRSYCNNIGYDAVITPGFQKFLDTRTDMEALAALGLSIKRSDKVHDEPFFIFKTVVDSICSRPLTDKQMWDSYLLYCLKRGANFSVPGSGKTATVLGVFGYLYDSGMVKRLIVIGPLNSFGTWEHEFSTVFGENIPLTSMNTSEIRERNGDVAYNIRFNSGNANLILLNYESFDHGHVLADAVSGRIGKDSMLVFDEVHRIKSPVGKRAAKLVPFGKVPQYAVVMTGTPIPNGYADAYNFLHILFPDDYDDYFRYTLSDLRNLQDDDADAMNMKLQPFFCRTTKDELGVPRANEDGILRVRATDTENQILDLLRHTVTGPLAMIIRILQLESDPMILNGRVSDLELSSFVDEDHQVEIGGLDIGQTCLTSKTSACLDLVQELVSEDKKVVVWCIFRHSIENISRRLEDRGITVCTVYGGTADMRGALDSFRGETQVLVTNPQTLAESVSLHTVCHDAVYFEYSYNLVHMLQSKDRIHRLGLEPGQYTQYHFMQTEFDLDGHAMSLDEEILSRLNEKERVMLDAIQGGSFEHSGTTIEEIEEMLLDLGLRKEAEDEEGPGAG